MKRFGLITAVVIAASLILSACITTGQATIAPPQTSVPGIPSTGQEEVNPVRLRALLDFDLQSSTGEELGSVSDLVIGREQPRIFYLVVSREGGQAVLIPWEALDRRGDVGQQFTLQFDTAVFANAPASQPEGLALGSQNWDGDVRRYWSGRGAANLDEASGRAMFARQMLGAPVVVPAVSISGQNEGNPVGVAITPVGSQPVSEIRDAIIDRQSGAVHYLLLSGDALGFSGRVIPVPYNMIQQRSTGSGFDLSVDLSRLQGAPMLDINALPAVLGIDISEALNQFWGSGAIPSQNATAQPGEPATR